MPQEGSSAAGWIGHPIELILNRHRHAVQNAERFSSLDGFGSSVSLRKDVLLVDCEKRSQRIVGLVAGLDGRQQFFGYLERCCAALSVGFNKNYLSLIKIVTISFGYVLYIRITYSSLNTP